VAQLNAAISIFVENSNFKNVLYGSLAKGKKQLLVYIDKRIQYIPLSDLSAGLKNLLIAIQNESHRFAIEYHHKLYRQQLKNGR
jgi:excinuclease UvrABC nuclease subunit